MRDGEILEALKQAEKDIEQAECRLIECKEETKAAKEGVKLATKRLRHLLHEANEERPLYDEG